MKRTLSGPALRIALTYIGIAAVWILTSDRILLWLAPDAPWAQTYKGLFYVIATGSLLYLAVRRELAERAKSEEETRQSEAALKKAQQVARMGSWQWNIKTNHLLWSDEMYHIFGIDKDSFTGDLSDVISLAIHPDDRTAVESSNLAVIQKSNPVPLEYRVVWPDGTVHVVRGEAGELLVDDSGGPAMLTGIAQDITERRQAEDALKHANEQLKAVMNAMPDIMFVVSGSGHIYDYATRDPSRLYVPPEQFIGKSVEEVIPPQAAVTIMSALKQAAQTGFHSGGTYSLDTPEGLRWFELSIAAAGEARGSDARLVVLIRNITERKLAEQKVRESEEQFRLLAENARDIIFRFKVKPALKIEYISPALVKITGYEPQELYDTPQLLLQIVHPEDRPRLTGSLTSLVPGESFMLRFIGKDGATKWMELRTTEVHDEQGDVRSVDGIARDISERVRAEQAEREEHALTEALLDTAAAINSTLDLQEVLKRILENVVKVMPADGANIMLANSSGDGIEVIAYSKGYAEHQLPEPIGATDTEIRQWGNVKYMAENKVPFVIHDTNDYPGWKPLPTTSWIRSYAGAPITSGGKILGFVNLDSRTPGAFTDVDAHHLQAFADQAAIALQNARLFADLEAHNERLEKAVSERTIELSRTMERVEAILSNSPDAILLLDKHANIEAANPAFYQMFHTDGNNYHSQPLHKLVTDSAVGAVRNAIQLVMAKQRTMRLEVRAQRGDGSEFPADMALAAIQEESKVTGVVCIIRDITTFKEVEAMKDQFVSNVSHELRTPITSLKLNHNLLQQDPRRMDVYMRRIERELDRLNILIEDILRLSRLDQGDTDLDMAPVDLNILVTQHVDDRTPIAQSRNQSLIADKKPNLPLVSGDSRLLGQALSVLLTNALNYTPTDGCIVVSTQTRLDGTVRQAGFAVSDTGPGIPLEDLSQLFKRFYRGKVGRDSGMPGTGLGLSIAQEIIQRHGGTIEVNRNDATASGSVFSVWLPAR